MSAYSYLLLLLLLSCFSRVQLCATPETAAHQAALSLGFCRQEHWSGLPFPSPEDLPDLGIKPRSSALQADALTSEPQGKLKERWAQKTWCFWTVVLETTLESLLDCKIKPVNPKGNQSWIFIGGTDAEAEAPILWHLMQRTDSLEKTLMMGKIEGRRRRGWQKMRCLDGITDLIDIKFEQALGVGEG